jgi:hypothetical protein
MAELYQKYNVGTNDPSAGLLAATRDQKANLKDIVSSITDLQKNTEGQIIQANTQQATDMLKQRLAQEGLGILAKPIDTELALRPFGNMIDKATVDKTVTEQTNLLKNNFINQFSAESDNILAQTNDPIKARENLKQRLLAAGAPSTFADQEAVNYDLRKVAE